MYIFSILKDEIQVRLGISDQKQLFTCILSNSNLLLSAPLKMKKKKYTRVPEYNDEGEPLTQRARTSQRDWTLIWREKYLNTVSESEYHIPLVNEHCESNTYSKNPASLLSR